MLNKWAGKKIKLNNKFVHSAFGDQLRGRGAHFVRMCYFCQKNVDDVDFKNIELLSKFVSGFYKIKPRKKTNLCSYHQKKIATAIKRARQMGLLPYTPK